MESELTKKAEAESESERTRGCLMNEKGGVVGEESLWANLPYDILCEIFSRLFGCDQAVCRCVCRSWKPVIPFNTNKKFPMRLINNNTISPACLSGTYLMYANGKKIIRPIYDEFHHANIFTIPGATVQAEKGGWFLMTTWDEIFLFNPITNEKVHLPEISELCVRAAYISAPPTSKSWMVILTCVSIPIVIWTIKRGENWWTPNKCKEESYFNISEASSAVVCKGLYYFLEKDKSLLIHDPKDNSFSYYEAPKSIIYKQLRTTDAQSYLLQCDGKVLAVFVSCDGSLIQVCRWNARKERWETLKNLGDKMLFVSRSSSICETATIKGTGNKIYFPRIMDDDNCLFYSLSTKKYHTFSGSSYRNFNGSKCPRNSIWIKF